MSIIAKVILYPLVIPVVLCYELSRFAWRFVSWHPFLLGLVSYCFGPLIAVLGGLELSSYLGWDLGLHWSIWLSSFFAFELAFLGVFWPLLVTLLKPLLWVLQRLGILAIELIGRVDYTLCAVSAKLGRMVPGYQFWKAEGFRSDSREVASGWFSILVVVFTVLSLGAHFLVFFVPLWSYFGNRLGSMAPWLTIVSHFTIVFIAAISPLLVFGLFGARVITSRRVSHIYGAASMMIVLDLLKWTPLLTNPPAWLDIPFSPLSLEYLHLPFSPLSLARFDRLSVTIALSITLYLITFIFILPILGLLSKRQFFTNALLAFLNACMQYHRWAMRTVLQEPRFLSFFSLCVAPLIIYVTYIVGNFFAVHPILVALHAIVIAVLCYPFAEYPVLVGAVDALITSLFVVHLSDHMWSTLVPFVATVVMVAAIPFIYGILFPLLALPLWPLALFTAILPSIVYSVIDMSRSKAHDLTTYIGNKWDRLLHNTFDDHSSFETMFGWLMTATLVALSTFHYAAFLFLSGTSPIFAFQQLGSFLVPDVTDLLSYKNINRTTFVQVLDGVIGLGSNATGISEISPEISQISANLTGAMNATSAAVAAGAASSTSALLGHRLVDVIVFVTVVSNVLILLGKLASRNAAPSFSVVNWVFWFSLIRQAPFTKCHYRIITELLAAELAIVVALLVAPIVYGLLLYFTRPFVPRLAPAICIPFERLWNLQQWMVRLWIRQYNNFWAFAKTVWDSVFGPRKPVRSQEPLYQRPRRYG